MKTVVFVVWASVVAFLVGIARGRAIEVERCQPVQEEADANRAAFEQCLEEIGHAIVVGQRLLVECER